MFNKHSLLALTFGVLRYQFTEAAATTALAPQAIPRENWVITADSQSSYEIPTNAIDDNLQTIWHTAWQNGNAPLPHWIAIDMGNTYAVNGLSYTPRQDGSTHGNIGTHSIQYSADGVNWIEVAAGTWANDQTIKTTLFTPIITRYVRLYATTEASNTGAQWSSAAELNVLTNPHPALARSNWQVTADSAQPLYEATYAVDSSPATFWHTQYTGTTPGFPHYFTINMGAAGTVGGIAMTPRPASSGPNGRIGQYTVQYSIDGNTWTSVTSGTWADTATQKFAEWQPVTAQYWRLVSQSEAGNRGQWSSASEIVLLDGSLNLANFIVTVDSQEINAQNNSAVNALDSDLTTIWHTEWYLAAPPYPHLFQIDMQATLPVRSLQYTPRQDGSSNGNIGQYNIQISTDGNTWTTVSVGKFADNAQAKLVQFQETTGRYVRLNALSEAGNRGPWASAAEILIGFDTSYVAPTPNTKGQWALTVDFPVVPVAVALTYDTGSVLAWSSYSAQTWIGGGTPQNTLTALYTPSTGLVGKANVVNTGHDMFCPGINTDFDGNIMVMGGNTARDTSKYTPTSGGWTQESVMNDGRGYQAAATLSNGWTFTIGGSWAGGVYQKNGEVYNPSTNTWKLINGADASKLLTNDAGGLFRADNHAWLFAWKNQAVFQAGPSKAMNWYTTTGNGGQSSAGTRNNAPDQMCGIAVMYDAVAGNILTAGGSPNYDNTPSVNNAYIVTVPAIVGAQATVKTVSPMAFSRIFANGVALPNGQIFVVGGQAQGLLFTDDASVMYPELYTPSTDTWTIMAPMAVPRNYHSVALLMPDATVIVGGGGLCDGCDYNHYDGQIFQPPYLFTSTGALATRPVINAVSATSIGIGKSLTITTGGPIASVAMVRLGTATHTVNTDQRRVPLTPIGSGTSWTVILPNDAGIALPGYWMLFVMDAAGVPSVSKTIKVTL